MTGIAQNPPEPYISDRTPHLFVVTLVGAALILTTIIRLLGAEPVRDHPLSGAPVEGAVEPTLMLPDQASASVLAATPAGRVLAGVADFEPAVVGPLPAARDGSLSIHVSLPTAEATVISVTASRLRLNGELRRGEMRTYPVAPGADGGATVTSPVTELVGDASGGIYQVAVTWNGVVLAEEYLALAAEQPTGIAVFDEPRKVRIKDGRHTAVRFDATGSVRAEKTRRAKGRTIVEAIAYARFDGRAHVLIASGRWDRHWMPLGNGVRLR
jgi:hypothetical protein